MALVNTGHGDPGTVPAVSLSSGLLSLVPQTFVAWTEIAYSVPTVRSVAKYEASVRPDTVVV